MTMEAKIRPWLLWVLAVVVAGALGYLGWYYTAGKKGAITASPSPTKSAAISPAASGSTKTSTPSGGTTTSSGGQTPTSDQTGRFDGYITDGDDKGDQYCNYKISFNYPSGYPSPSYDGYLIVQKDSSSRLEIQPATDHEGGCNPGSINDPVAYYDMWHYGEIQEGPTYYVGGYPMVQWTQVSDAGTPSHPNLAKKYLRVAFIMEGTRYVRISTGYTVSNTEGFMSSRETTFDSAFDTVVRSFRFK